jgi:transposase-like protein
MSGVLDSGNVRNGTRPKTVLTGATGHVAIDVSRDRDGTFDPVIVKNVSAGSLRLMRMC